jgi:hypothetical protein
VEQPSSRTYVLKLSHTRSMSLIDVELQYDQAK